MYAFRAPGVKCLQHHLGVAVGEEAIALRLEFRAQILVVVDTAVERDCQAQLAVHHGLAGMAAEIDNAQPPMPQRNAPLLEQPAAVGTARFHGLIDRAQRAQVDGFVVETDFTAKSTHQQVLEQGLGEGVGRVTNSRCGRIESCLAETERRAAAGERLQLERAFASGVWIMPLRIWSVSRALLRQRDRVADGDHSQGPHTLTWSR